MRKLWATRSKWSLVMTALAIFSLSGYVVAVPPPPFNFGVHPFEFDPAQTKLVSAQWVNGAGCPTGATGFIDDPLTLFVFDPIPTPVTDPACLTGDAQDNNNKGLVLFKTGPTANVAASGAFLTFNQQAFTLTEMGYDTRSGSHCGAGAPRFNVRTSDGVLHFVGCNTGTVISSSLGWKRLQWTAASLAISGVGQTAFPPILATDVVLSISIIFDEGQDASGGPDSSGMAVLDNINVNGVRVGKP